MPEMRICSSCGAELPEDAPGGVCVPCALRSLLNDSAAPAKSPSQIGRYRLLERIGEGGCGVVYQAEQLEPIRRFVALKIIKPGMDSRQVPARFEAERQVLALMDHPNIAKVFDAGESEAGHPYFVMELVKGQRITDYCNTAKLSTQERLALFVQVCQAVQHAHQKGIIHRDIKPSNILVTQQDGKAVPKVIDFGIAKATSGQHLTNQTTFTAFDQFIGTPAYMSPEQAGTNSADIDTRSDVYALGVLLYEILTGQTPFEARELIAKGLEEIRRIIRETDPPRPSARLSALAAKEQTTIADQRQTKSLRLIEQIRGDLDWIVMKALEKEPKRRYETATAFADDIARYLSDEPVIARPPTQSYRLGKLLRRNKLAFAAGAAVLVSLIACLLVSTALYFRELSAERKANALNQFLMDDILRQGIPQGAMTISGFDTNLTFQVVLKHAIKKAPETFKGQPLQEAAIDLALADGLIGMDDSSAAIPVIEHSLHLRWEALGSNASLTLDAMNELADAYLATDKPEKAEAMLKSWLAGRVPSKSSNRGELVAMNNLACCYLSQPDIKPAISLLKETLARDKEFLGASDRETLAATVNLALASRISGAPEYTNVVPLLEEAVRIAKSTLGPDDPDTLEIMNSLAVMYQETMGKTGQAPLLFSEVFKTRSVTLGPDNPATMMTLVSSSRDMLNRNDCTNAEQLLRQGLDSWDNRPGAWLHAAVESHLGLVLLKQGKYSDAEEPLLKSYSEFKRHAAEIPPGARQWMTEAGQAITNLYGRLGETNKLEIWRKKLAEQHP